MGSWDLYFAKKKDFNYMIDPIIKVFFLYHFIVSSSPQKSTSMDILVLYLPPDRT